MNGVCAAEGLGGDFGKADVFGLASSVRMKSA